VSFPTHTDDRKESTIAQHCIKAIAGEVVKSRTVHLINFSGGGQVIALKSATALILDRCASCKNPPHKQAHLVLPMHKSNVENQKSLFLPTLPNRYS
jgi:hypothetical protein